MLYSLFVWLHKWFSPFNVFRYITFRTALAIITSQTVCCLMIPGFIRWARRLGGTQNVRDDGPQAHLKKQGTPTMGGIVIAGSIVISMLLWGDLKNPFVLLMIAAVAGFSGIGFLDDYLKVVKKNSKGLLAKQKFGLQIALALVLAILIHRVPHNPYAGMLSIPFLKKWLIRLGWLYTPFAILVIVGASNAVNLTDGIDGLAIGLVAIAALANGVLIYISGHRILSAYLHVLYLPQAAELTVFCGAMFGAALGFLWYNSYPADLFMGDVGSLGLGGALGTLAVISKQEIILAVVGGIFVMESVSVILQVASFKLTGRRIFRMAPIHHHFELKGWTEPKVIVRFWIVGIILALLSLATFKVR
ncbi:MAG: phospho-N-acetylmuramoyl-pentapeptide-transferase [Nitrospiraceae bacterium]|nr:phospho-N-acetylmuramoyl-pentapeptide-transferase [Nitrospiraceae bacterium]